MSRSFFITQILKSLSITDYLSSLNIQSHGEINNRIRYTCPLHEGDNDPSFFVFTDGEFQNYVCFGCNSKGNIINLVAEKNGWSKSKTIVHLASDILIDPDSNINDMTDEIQKDIEQEFSKEKIDDIYFKINRYCYDYLYNNDFDEIEVIFFDNVFQVVDKCVRSFDTTNMNKIYDKLTRECVPKRQKKYNMRKNTELSREILNA